MLHALTGKYSLCTHFNFNRSDTAILRHTTIKKWSESNELQVLQASRYSIALSDMMQRSRILRVRFCRWNVIFPSLTTWNVPSWLWMKFPGRVCLLISSKNASSIKIANNHDKLPGICIWTQSFKNYFHSSFCRSNSTISCHQLKTIDQNYRNVTLSFRVQVKHFELDVQGVCNKNC